MVDGVKFNPFTGQVFTTEELQKLDANKDGVISSGELFDGMSWLAENNNANAFGNKLYENAVNAGLKTYKAETIVDFKDAMDIVSSEYYKLWLENNASADSSLKSIVKSYVEGYKTTFINKQLAENPQGPWYIKQLTVDFEKEMNAIIGGTKTEEPDSEEPANGPSRAPKAHRHQRPPRPPRRPEPPRGPHRAPAATKPTITLDELSEIAASASENGYISNEEWDAIKDGSAEYLLSLFAENPQIDLLIAEMFKGMDENYQTNPYYLMIVDSLNTIAASSNKREINAELKKVEEALKNFFDSCDRINVANSIVNTDKNYVLIKTQENLSSVADNWLEENITAEMSDEERLFLVNFASTAKTQFIEACQAKGNLADIDAVELQTEFAEYLQTQFAQYKEVQGKLMDKIGNTEKATDKLYGVSDRVSHHRHSYVRDHMALIKAGSDVIISELFNGNEDISLLSQLNPDFKSTKEFEQLKDLIAQMKTSSDVNEVKDLLHQARKISASLLKGYSVRELIEAVDKTKPIEISDKTNDNALSRSGLGSDYDNGTIRSSYFSYNDDGALISVKNQAKSDLYRYANSLKDELRRNLGTAYNDREIQKFINDAINDTIDMFVQNSFSASAFDSLDEISDNAAFVKASRPHSRRSSYSYSVTSLIDAFVANFNENVKTKQAAKEDPSQITYDRENVLANSYYSNNYDTENVVSGYSKRAIKNNARTVLSNILQGIKKSMHAEGSQIDRKTTDWVLGTALKETLEEYPFENNSFNTKDLIDLYMSKVDSYFGQVNA